MKTLFLLALIILAGCIYETPQAVQLSVKDFNSTAGTFEEKETTDLPEFKLRTETPASHTVKAVENIYDGCNGCIDFVAATAVSMRRFNPDLPYSFIVALSGAAKLDDKGASLEEFLGSRLSLYGFKAFYASAELNSKLRQFYAKYDLKATPIKGQGSIVYLQLITSSNAVPIVAVDRFYLHHELLRRYQQEKEKFHDPIFVPVVGYDQNIKINNPTLAGASYLDITPQDFYDGWLSEVNDYGPLFTWYVLRESDPIDEEEAKVTIRKDILLSHNVLKRELSEQQLKQGFITRKALADWLDDKEQAGKFRQSSVLFKEMIDERNINKVNDIIALEKEVIDTWALDQS
ncbi:hypothetical protein GOV09_03905 [Candidatus Woesearchaeota archaeon]|nr:hypothetical protein [Candidatus Woesearchaeota archaeon]